MRITYFADTYRLGGAERFLTSVIAGAVGGGHDVTMISPQASVLELVGAEVPAATLVRLKTDLWASTPRPARRGAFARVLCETAVAFRRARPQLIHINNGGYPGSDVCRAAAIVTHVAGGARCVLSVHSAPWPRPGSHPRAHAIADGLVWRSVDAVHVGTAFGQRRLAELRAMPPDLGRHIPYGVAEPSGTTDAVAALRRRLAPENELLVGMVSATAEVEKGHAVLAWALAQAGPDVRAVIVGANPGDDFVGWLAASGLSDRVAVVGRVQSADFGAHLRAMDVLVVPSTAYESLPLVILEAMAAGKPVFGSRLSGIPEAVDDGTTGRLFEPGAVEKLATLLRQATGTRDELANMGRRGRERWQATFSTAVMTASMLDLYERLVGRTKVIKR
jgi:glycosyltransferase involved in cell wall biosynthesis